MRPKPRSKLSREGGALSKMLCLEVLFGGRGASLHTESKFRLAKLQRYPNQQAFNYGAAAYARGERI